MEYLFVDFLLWKVGFESDEPYHKRFDHIALSKQQSDFLMNLERFSCDKEASYRQFILYWENPSNSLNKNIFVKELFGRLESIFEMNMFSIKAFAQKCHILWDNLPEDLKTDNKLDFLNVAENYVSYMNETEINKLFKQLLRSYQNEKVIPDVRPKKNFIQEYAMIIYIVLCVVFIFLAPESSRLGIIVSVVISVFYIPKIYKQ